jgi:FdhE protein
VTTAKWDARIRRAGELKSAHSYAIEGLSFYEQVAGFQKSIYADLEAHLGTARKRREPGMLRQDLDFFALLPRFAPFLGIIEKSAPGSLSKRANQMREKESSEWQRRLEEFWQKDSFLAEHVDPSEALICWMFLRPYAEYLGDHTLHEPLHGTPSLCPLCNSKPLVGVLRPEGDGAKRSLICSLCATEWSYRRIVCPECGEEDVRKLAVYTAEQFKHVRVDACDTCRNYIKTVDLTKNGHAVPEVDELATIPLNLWAADHGYSKSQTNLLGI